MLAAAIEEDGTTLDKGLLGLGRVLVFFKYFNKAIVKYLLNKIPEKTLYPSTSAPIIGFNFSQTYSISAKFAKFRTHENILLYDKCTHFLTGLSIYEGYNFL